jgi:hypothetical protein
VLCNVRSLVLHPPLLRGIDTPAHVSDTWGYKGWQKCFQGITYNTCPDNVAVSRLFSLRSRRFVSLVGFVGRSSRSVLDLSSSLNKNKGRRFGSRSGSEPHELRVHAVSAKEGTVHDGANDHDGEQVWYVQSTMLCAEIGSRLPLFISRLNMLRTTEFYRYNQTTCRKTNVPCRLDAHCCSSACVNATKLCA